MRILPYPSSFFFHPHEKRKFTSIHHRIYHLAYAILKMITVTMQYSVIYSSANLNRFFYIFDPIPRKYLKVSTCNVACLKLIRKALASMIHPYPRENYQHLGVFDDLLISHDISLHPANGSCLGMSLDFLVRYLKQTPSYAYQLILDISQVFKMGATEKSLEIQAIYDTFLGIHHPIDKEEQNFFCKILKKQDLPSYKGQNQNLIEILKDFVADANSNESLRQYVFEKLKNQNFEVTPDIYSLVLELDACWNFQQHIDDKKYDSIHYAAIKTLVDYLQLELVSMSSLKGNMTQVQAELQQLPEGCYLIQTTRHMVVMIKLANNQTILWDANAGLALLSNSQQESECLNHFLSYYFNGQHIALRLFNVQNGND